MIAPISSRVILCLLVLVLAGSGNAFAQSEDAAYYCVGEAAGGLHYNKATKKWEGTSFRPSEKFVLKMKFVRERTQKGKYGEEQVKDYMVTLTESGEHVSQSCEPDDYSSAREVTVHGSQYFICFTTLAEYRFNVRTNRFIYMYPGVYLGNDKSDNPVIEGGTCTKID